MGRKGWIGIIAGESCLLLALLAAVVGLHLGWFSEPEEETLPAMVLTTEETVPPTTTQPATEATETEPSTETAETETEPQEIVYTLTFAGDCTLGTMYQYYNAASCFPAVVGDDFDYPFANVQTWFAQDDFTMVNLEGPLTDSGTPADKTYVFRGDPKYVQVLTAGSVECVSLANNHSQDFGTVGYENTEKTLEEAGVAYAGDGESCLVETERGLKIGVFCVAFSVSTDYMASQIAELRANGAEIVIVSFHWGIEGAYHHNADQESYAHAAIDAGADIVFGHHPHVLQEIETYGNGIIYYSLGNFSFGGNGNPRDYDTAIISQQVIRDPDGTVRLGECTRIPCSISSVSYPNNYQPTPAEEGSERYERVLTKLDGTFTGADLPLPTTATEASTEAGTTEETGTTAETSGEPSDDSSESTEEESSQPTEEDAADQTE